MWRQPTNLSEGEGDEAMMEEILNLLATDSPDAAHQATASTNASTGGCNNVSSNITNRDFNASASQDCEAACPGNDGCTRGRDLPNEFFFSLPNDELNIEEKHSAVPGQEIEEGSGEVLGISQQTQNAMPNILTPLAQAAPTRHPMRASQRPVIQPLPPSQPLYHLPGKPYFAAEPGLIASAATMDLPCAASPVPMNQFQAARAHPVPYVQSASTQSQSRPSLPKAKKGGSVAKKLPTGQELYVMNLAELGELRRKQRMQTASRRYRKRKKEEIKQKKTQIQELQAELARLQQLEAQSKQYQQRSVDSLHEELKMHKAEVADLSSKLQEAAKEERHWINLMKAHLNK